MFISYIFYTNNLFGSMTLSNSLYPKKLATIKINVFTAMFVYTLNHF